MNLSLKKPATPSPGTVSKKRKPLLGAIPCRGVRRLRLQLLSPRLKSWTVSHRIDFDCELGNPIAIVVSNSDVLLEEHVLSGPGVYERGLTDAAPIFPDGVPRPPLSVQFDIVNVELFQKCESCVVRVAYGSVVPSHRTPPPAEAEVLSRLIACLSVVTGVLLLGLVYLLCFGLLFPTCATMSLVEPPPTNYVHIIAYFLHECQGQVFCPYSRLV